MLLVDAPRPLILSRHCAPACSADKVDQSKYASWAASRFVENGPYKGRAELPDMILPCACMVHYVSRIARTHW
jgi:hypothetical protein